MGVSFLGYRKSAHLTALLDLFHDFIRIVDDRPYLEVVRFWHQISRKEIFETKKQAVLSGTVSDP